MIEQLGKYTNAKIMIDQIEPDCLAQIIRMINHESFTNPVSVMPDTHLGTGSVIGFTMKIGDKVVPNVVGSDGYCAMLSFNIGNLVINLKELDYQIRREIPFGTIINPKPKVKLPAHYKSLCKRIGVDYDYAVNSIGSLGSGNHFIEIGKSPNTEDVWITIHSGSRNFGSKLCKYWQDRAYKRPLPDFKKIIEDVKEKFPKKEWETQISHAKNCIGRIKKTELDFIEGKDIDDYLLDMLLCDHYAMLNRKVMMDTILTILRNSILNVSFEVKDKIETVHNYIDFKDMIIRKGAIRSYVGERILIPFNMKDGILICEGKSNQEWNFSAPHGAGRLFSRTEARKKLSLEKFEKDMNGIYSTSVCRSTIDEAPEAYKDPKLIESLIEPTAKVIDRIIPIHNMKDKSDEKSWKERRMLQMRSL